MSSFGEESKYLLGGGGGGTERARQSLSVTSLGFRTLLSTAKCYSFGATLTTTVSGVITPAGSVQFSGYMSRITTPKYTCTLADGGIDPGYRLVLSETERSLPVCNHFRFYIQIERILPRRGTNKPKAATSYESARFIGDIGEHDTSKTFTTMF